MLFNLIQFNSIQYTISNYADKSSEVLNLMAVYGNSRDLMQVKNVIIRQQKQNRPIGEIAETGQNEQFGTIFKNNNNNFLKKSNALVSSAKSERLEDNRRQEEKSLPLSKSTIKRCLHKCKSRNFISRCKTLIQNWNQKARLDFARKHLMPGYGTRHFRKMKPKLTCM